MFSPRGGYRLEWVDGGVAAPRGFLASGTHCGLKKNGQPDLALLVSTTPAESAGVFTTNQVKGHSLLWTRARAGKPVRAVVVNSGSANACLGPRGDEDAAAMAGLAARTLGFETDEVLLASTGVIGQPLDLASVAAKMADAAAGLSPTGGGTAARAIVTTDSFTKEAAVSLVFDGRTMRIGGMAKGAGMIHPDLATLLVFLTTDAPVAADGLKQALMQAVAYSFHAITVDGDTSPCDSVILLANGQAGGPPLAAGSPEFAAFADALGEVALSLAVMVARDGEGATKLITIEIKGAHSPEEARLIGRTVAVSPLVKTAIHGADANWGRILSAVGRAGIPLDPSLVSIALGGVEVCTKGAALPFSEDEARRMLAAREVDITIDLGRGTKGARVWTCDLSPEYVRINGSYRS